MSLSVEPTHRFLLAPAKAFAPVLNHGLRHLSIDGGVGKGEEFVQHRVVEAAKGAQGGWSAAHFKPFGEWLKGLKEESGLSAKATRTLLQFISTPGCVAGTRARIQQDAARDLQPGLLDVLQGPGMMAASSIFGESPRALLLAHFAPHFCATQNSDRIVSPVGSISVLSFVDDSAEPPTSSSSASSLLVELVKHIFLSGHIGSCCSSCVFAVHTSARGQQPFDSNVWWAGVCDEAKRALSHSPSREHLVSTNECCPEDGWTQLVVSVQSPQGQLCERQEEAALLRALKCATDLNQDTLQALARALEVDCSRLVALAGLLWDRYIERQVSSDGQGTIAAARSAISEGFKKSHTSLFDDAKPAFTKGCDSLTALLCEEGSITEVRADLQGGLVKPSEGPSEGPSNAAVLWILGLYGLVKCLQQLRDFSSGLPPLNMLISVMKRGHKLSCELVAVRTCAVCCDGALS